MYPGTVFPPLPLHIQYTQISLQMHNLHIGGYLHLYNWPHACTVNPSLVKNIARRRMPQHTYCRYKPAHVERPGQHMQIISPTYGQITPTYGKISPIYWKISPHLWKNIPHKWKNSPSYGKFPPHIQICIPTYAKIFPHMEKYPPHK